MSPSLPPLLARVAAADNRTALVDGDRLVTYRELDAASRRVAAALLDGTRDLDETRVAFLVPPGIEYVAALFGIWRAGGIAVPLAMSHPPAELEYVIRDAGAAIVVAHPSYAGMLTPSVHSLGARLVTTADLLAPLTDAGPSFSLADASTDACASRRALMLYTSGTTGKPKGVVTTHANVTAQVRSLVAAWEWTPDDRALLVLPLHHVHGIINVVCSALWPGAACEMHTRFDTEATWARLASGAITVFTAVPTIYHKLIASWDAAPAKVRRARSEGCRQVRLMMSGSAALPVQTLERWRAITGHTLLERYGMTEIGMGLSNPLHGERRPGFVGAPLPGVQVRLVDETGATIAAAGPSEASEPGEIEVRGPGVFLEYWRRPGETARAFRDGWFRTGDISVTEDGAYRIVGRASIDIIKTGGYKVSALEIEEVVRAHASVADCAVVGVPDPSWGERVCAAVELRAGAALSIEELQAFARAQLAPYKVPKDLRCVTTLPRNAMGKVVKAELARLFNSDAPSAAARTRRSPGPPDSPRRAR
jgi:malonyl-CoA/methylmalonyl-CoA synthetase